MKQPAPDDQPHATFVFEHEGEEYVSRDAYERLRALVLFHEKTLAVINAVNAMKQDMALPPWLTDREKDALRYVVERWMVSGSEDREILRALLQRLG